jgi:hypothetical protein
MVARIVPMNAHFVANQCRKVISPRTPGWRRLNMPGHENGYFFIRHPQAIQALSQHRQPMFSTA